MTCGTRPRQVFDRTPAAGFGLVVTPSLVSPAALQPEGSRSVGKQVAVDKRASLPGPGTTGAGRM